jgi:outer membrane murein-binding lipoprotein Lpp
MNQRTPKLFVVSLVLTGAILTGCQRNKGPDLQAEVDRLNAQVADLQSKLAATEKAAESRKEELGQVAAAAEAAKRELAGKNLALSQKEEQVRTLQTEMGQLRKSDGLIFAQISAVQAKGESANALERYEKFIAEFPDSPLATDARRALADLKPIVEKETKWKTDLINPRREERELLKRFADGIVTTQELAPLLRRRTSAEVISLLGRPGRSFRNGTEYGYIDKVIDTATGNKETLVIRFESGRVGGLRAGYQGKELTP